MSVVDTKISHDHIIALEFIEPLVHKGRYFIDEFVVLRLPNFLVPGQEAFHPR